MAWLDQSAWRRGLWALQVSLALTGVTGPLRSDYNCHSTLA